MREATEVNYDGIVGPTHNFVSLTLDGRLFNPETDHPSQVIAYPQQAALEGLEKMRLASRLGAQQAVVPPHERPALSVLRRLGFSGSDHQVLSKAWHRAPDLTAHCFSSSFMWAANAATVTPSNDSPDQRIHITPANLCRKFHRSIEAEFTTRLLKRLFPQGDRFCHHPALPSSEALGDEGSANHVRFSRNFKRSGTHLFVYGHSALHPDAACASRFPSRQSLEASRSIARLHQLDPKSVVFAQQSREALNAGAFHNDVISMGHRSLFISHQRAFENTASVLAQLRVAYTRSSLGANLQTVLVPESQLPVNTAVQSYLFNSQLIDMDNHRIALLAPEECKTNQLVQTVISEWVQDVENPVHEVHYASLNQSMRSGGGPACLRLKVLLNEEERQAAHAGVFFNDDLAEKLELWVRHHYRETLSVDDLKDPNLIDEGSRALDELTQLLELGSLYEFQR